MSAQMHKIERNSNIDKTKGLLIFLVVFGHFVERYMGWHGDLSGALLRFIYAVHMPAFIFISGMFRSFIGNLYSFERTYFWNCCNSVVETDNEYL